MKQALELALIVPVYNEEEAIVSVLQEWITMLREQKLAFTVLVINDGSTDNTLALVEKFRDTTGPEIICHTQPNQGHGQSCLNGYRLAIGLGVPFIFQIDSDGQCDPIYFPALWVRRDEQPSVYGYRKQRDDGLVRIVVSGVLRHFLKVLCRTKLNDTNVPYRLYQSSVLKMEVDHIPKDFHLANIAMALLMERHGFLEIPIGFRDRKGGEAGVKLWSFAARACQLYGNLQQLKQRVRTR